MYAVGQGKRAVNGRPGPANLRAPAHLDTHRKEVRVSDHLSNPRGVRQPVAQDGPGLKREWLTYAEAGEIVGLSRVTLWKLISAKAIKVRRVGRAVRINRASLDAYMNAEAAGE